MRDIRSWVDAGASLCMACMNARVSESRFAPMVAELESGRNNEFAAALRQSAGNSVAFRGRDLAKRTA